MTWEQQNAGWEGERNVSRAKLAQVSKYLFNHSLSGRSRMAHRATCALPGVSCSCLQHSQLLTAAALCREPCPEHPEQPSLWLQVDKASSCSAPQLCLNKENFENPYLRGRTTQVAIGKRGCQQSD